MTWETRWKVSWPRPSLKSRKCSCISSRIRHAVKLLKGAWTLTVSRKAGDDMRLRYADFASGTIEKAVQGGR